ncbi:class I SAM-dependent methyltransferase [Listeria sp. SHR_NRA_18]|uniref:class I SAM-dependent methyltransferase n=1 Tax=Listeria sp. SHR_NRA_18 TaxID=2269046 RepID=UPI00051D2071|nr:class I SAM-dependent methyltransferase [Listeria sp. SHR_NRA_18]KGL38069.1 16S rRNA methyltransferase [Listeriaceae bacterium FSL A5-0209]RQW65597.1 class I SAM-dependent methyltransferase [Listeria sp. SHR_NRA_18]
MSNKHYYTKNSDLDHKRKTWTFELRGTSIKFISDAGVFSKTTVDFGSRLLIESFEASDAAGKILDVGCGYGPIGLAFAKSYPEAQVDMIDVNDRALELSAENAANNGLTNVRVFESSVYDGVADRDYTDIISNPPIRAGKKIVHEILTGSFDRLETGGSLWIVIQKKQGGPSAAAKMEEVFGNVEVVAKDKGYFIYRSMKEI